MNVRVIDRTQLGRLLFQQILDAMAQITAWPEGAFSFRPDDSPGYSSAPPPLSFRVQVPAEYAVVGQHGAFTGAIDDRIYDRPRYLGAGMHTIAFAQTDQTYALVWSRAVAKGFSPFPRRTRRGHMTS